MKFSGSVRRRQKQRLRKRFLVYEEECSAATAAAAAIVRVIYKPGIYAVCGDERAKNCSFRLSLVKRNE